MRTKNETVQELNKRIHCGESHPSIVDILLEDGHRILVRTMTAEKVGTETYIATRYEIWSDKNKFLEGIPAEGNNIYCTGYAGSSEGDIIALFLDEGSKLKNKVVVTDQEYMGKSEIYTGWYKCNHCEEEWVKHNFKFCPICGYEIEWQVKNPPADSITPL